MRRLVILVFVLCLLPGFALARDLASFRLPPPEMAAHVQVMQVKGDDGNAVPLVVVIFEHPPLMLVALSDGTPIMIRPDVERDEVWVDRAMCPRHGKFFPEGAVPTGDFIRWDQCLRPA